MYYNECDKCDTFGFPQKSLETQASPQDLVEESGGFDVTAFRGVTHALMTQITLS
jgi:hypothetical protein